MRLLLNSYIHETRGPKRHKFHYGQIKRSRHGPRCGHTPIDTISYRPAWPWYINIEHVLHCENIIHIPTLFYYFAIPTPFFHFQCFFYLLMYRSVQLPVAQSCHWVGVPRNSCYWFSTTVLSVHDHKATGNVCSYLVLFRCTHVTASTLEIGLFHSN